MAIRATNRLVGDQRSGSFVYKPVQKTYIPPLPTPPRIPLSPEGERFRLESQESAGELPPPPPPVDEPRDKGRGTDPVRVYDTSDYSGVAPALSSAQLGAFGERRRIAQEEYEKTLAAVARNDAIYRSDAERQRENQEELATRYIADSTRELAGKGVARAPMFMGRMARAADQDLQMKWGEIDSELGIELSALKSLVDNARSKKETELAKIDQDVASARSNLNAIFSAASMYGNV